MRRDALHVIGTCFRAAGLASRAVRGRGTDATTPTPGERGGGDVKDVVTIGPATAAEREAFIASHMLVCKAERCRRYDRRKGRGALHSLGYSRRKCAKALWRRTKGRGDAGRCGRIARGAGSV
jgi:hypothetical protein